MEKGDCKRKSLRIPKGYAVLGLIGLAWVLPVIVIVLVYRAACRS